MAESKSNSHRDGFRKMAERGRSEDGRWPHEPAAPDDGPATGVREPRRPLPLPVSDAVDRDEDSDEFLVVAVPWEHGLELHVEGVGVTQTHEDYPADTAEHMASDYIASMLDRDQSTFTVRIEYPRGALEPS